jgi:prophage regulatory protein
MPNLLRLIPASQLGTLKGITYCRAHLDRLVKAGKFPRPIKIGPGRNAYLEAEIDAYINARIAERDAAASTGEA